VTLLVDEGLARAEVDRAVALEHASDGLLVLEPAKGDGEKGIALDVLPISLLEDAEPVKAGPLKQGEELFLRERPDEALAPEPGVHLEVRWDLALAHDVRNHDAAVIL